MLFILREYVCCALFPALEIRRKCPKFTFNVYWITDAGNELYAWRVHEQPTHQINGRIIEIHLQVVRFQSIFMMLTKTNWGIAFKFYLQNGTVCQFICSNQMEWSEVEVTEKAEKMNIVQFVIWNGHYFNCATIYS